MSKEKEIYITQEEIDKKVKEFKTPDEKKEFLRGLYTDKDHSKLKRHVTNEYTKILLAKPTDQYNLVYDSLSEGLEPIYYWILDFMRDSSPGGLGLNVFKGPEDFEASVTSGYYGEIGQRASLMQQKAGEYLGAINQVIKSILNLLYDLKEFDLRIALYDKLTDSKEREGALQSLKAVWMDTVDTKKGRGSINLLAQDLGFQTLREAFFYVDKQEDIQKVDLHERVRRLLRIKLTDFNHWLTESEKEVKSRAAIERAYLRSQVDSLKMYAGWAKPYLKAAQKLKMKEFKTPDIVNSFSNIEIQLELLGKDEVKPTSLDLPQKYKHKFENGELKLEKKYYSVIDVTMGFRGIPSAVTTQGGRQYVHGGRADIKFKAYVFDQVELEAIENRELYEDMDLVEQWVDVSMETLRKEIEAALNPVKKEEKKEDKALEIDWPFKGTIKGFKETFGPITNSFKFLKSKPPTQLFEEDLKKKAEVGAQGSLKVLYTVYKKAHGMLAV